MMEYRFDEAARIVVITGLPDGVSGENVTLIRSILSDPRYGPDYGFLRDRRGLAPLSIEDATKAASISEAVPELRGKHWAIVVDDLVNFGTSRMQQTIAEWHGLEVRIFKDLEEARQWLRRGSKPTPEHA